MAKRGRERRLPLGGIMLDEQDRLRCQNRELQKQINQMQVEINFREQTIAAQDRCLSEYEHRMQVQQSRLKSLLWSFLALLVMLILAAAALVQEGK